MSQVEALSQEENYTEKYLSLFTAAMLESLNLGFTRPAFVSARDVIPDDVLRNTAAILTDFSEFLSSVQPGYWGNACQTLSTNIFAYLNANGIHAEIVIGNVFIRHINEFGTTLDTLKAELSADAPRTDSQSLHVWVSLGGDTIVDAAMPPRLVANYRAPERFNDTIFIARASQLASVLRLKYHPLLVGSEFIARTNSQDPLEFIDRWRCAKG